MAKFSVLVSALENEKSKYNSYKGELSSYSSKINSAKNVLPILGDTAVQLKNALAKSKENVNTLSDNAHNLSQTLEQICLLYINVEKNSNNSSDNNYVVSKSENNPFSKFFPPFTNNLFYTGLLELIRKIFKGNKINGYEIDSIVFDDKGSFGGDQGAAQKLKNNSEERKQIESIIRRNLKDCDGSDNINLANYLNKLNSEGCGYVALANTIFVYYQGKEKDFEQAFGYAMYNKNGDLNYNLLIADVYSSMDNRKNGVYNKYDDYNSDKDGEYDTYNPWNDKSGQGSNPENYQNYLNSFMSKRGIDSEVAKLESNTMTIEILKKYTDSGNSVLLGYYNGNIYKENGEIQQYIDGGHGMIVTGITYDGKYIVSSWGEKYIIDPNEGQCELYTIKYSEK